MLCYTKKATKFQFTREYNKLAQYHQNYLQELLRTFSASFIGMIVVNASEFFIPRFANGIAVIAENLKEFEFGSGELSAVSEQKSFIVTMSKTKIFRNKHVDQKSNCSRI